MEDPLVLERMRADWNRRAAEDAHYYVAFGRREQDEEEFYATARDVVRGLTAELKRLAAREAALEIGCGPGRLMRPMARHFREIHGVDVSDEMIRLARERLRDVPNAHPRVTAGSDLAMFPDARFDFVYSYAVFQHIPSREVVFRYLREAWRVLKPGGVLRCQLNGLPATAKQYDTWSGVRIAPEEIRAFAREQGFQLLALEDIWTQYMWTTMRKVGQAICLPTGPCIIRNVNSAFTGEPAAPDSGPMAMISLRIANLPPAADLNNLTVTADGAECRVTYIGELAADGATQVNAVLPER
ncbi:MAG TPA: class I SAM-dependent methyltransferase, partial [Burkholderiales bacterium]|nr:class I SAM-dependent methyltransferase [Burkholderiales bacterium]